MVPWLDFSITKNAIKMMKRLDEDTRNRILNGIYKLPCGDVKRLHGYTDYFRLRIGNYRVIYTCKLNTVTIVAVLPRGDVYKHI